jgi:hypothetical protein
MRKDQVADSKIERYRLLEDFLEGTNDRAMQTFGGVPCIRNDGKKHTHGHGITARMTVTMTKSHRFMECQCS